MPAIYHFGIRHPDHPADFADATEEDTEDAARHVMSRRWPTAQILWVSRVTPAEQYAIPEYNRPTEGGK